MASKKFEIFEDRENFEENKLLKFGELKRDKSKLVPFARKENVNENANEQVSKTLSIQNEGNIFCEILRFPSIYTHFHAFYIDMYSFPRLENLHQTQFQ